MKKILLIEDREKRQQLFSVQTGITFENYSDIVENSIDDKYNALFNEIIIGQYDLDAYDIIISHKSAFGEQNSVVLKILEEHCRTYSKPLVLFSGGIVGNYYSNEDYEVLELNSEIFYSHNLSLFFEAVKTGNDNLLMLSYGKQWKLNIIMSVLERLNLYIDIKDEKLFKYIKMDRLEQIGIVCGEIDINDTLKELLVVRECLLVRVKDSIDG